MIIEGSTLKLGGNKILYWIGSKIQKLGSNMIHKHRQILVTNPTCKLANPFTLIISFTVDGLDKYQIVVQGDYKKFYKESEDSIPDISEKELFHIINQGQKNWFKKE